MPGDHRESGDGHPPSYCLMRAGEVIKCGGKEKLERRGGPEGGSPIEGTRFDSW